MVCPPCKFCSHENHHPTHLKLLQTLNLIAAIFIGNTESKAGIPLELNRTGASKIATSLRLLDTLHKVVEEVHRAAEEVIDQVVRRSHVQVRYEFRVSCAYLLRTKLSSAGRPRNRPQTS